MKKKDNNNNNDSRHIQRIATTANTLQSLKHHKVISKFLSNNSTITITTTNDNDNNNAKATNMLYYKRVVLIESERERNGE